MKNLAAVSQWWMEKWKMKASYCSWKQAFKPTRARKYMCTCASSSPARVMIFTSFCKLEWWPTYVRWPNSQSAPKWDFDRSARLNHGSPQEV